MRAPKPADIVPSFDLNGTSARGSWSAADQGLLPEVASAGYEIRYNPPSAIVGDDIERHVGGDGEVRTRRTGRSDRRPQARSPVAA